MAICPNHGGDTGGACKKGQPHAGMNAFYISGQTGNSIESNNPPKLDDADRATVLMLENHLLKLIQQHQSATQQLQMFINAMYEKYGVKQAEYLFDVDKTGFIARGM